MDEGAHLVSGLRGQQRRSIAGAFEVLPVRVTPKRRGEPISDRSTVLWGNRKSLTLRPRSTRPPRRAARSWLTVHRDPTLGHMRRDDDRSRSVTAAIATPSDPSARRRRRPSPRRGRALVKANKLRPVPLGPVTTSSAKAFNVLADSSRRHNPWAADIYDRGRARGASHSTRRPHPRSRLVPDHLAPLARPRYRRPGPPHRAPTLHRRGSLTGVGPPDRPHRHPATARRPGDARPVLRPPADGAAREGWHRSVPLAAVAPRPGPWAAPCDKPLLSQGGIAPAVLARPSARWRMPTARRCHRPAAPRRGPRD